MLKTLIVLNEINFSNANNFVYELNVELVLIVRYLRFNILSWNGNSIQIIDCIELLQCNWLYCPLILCVNVISCPICWKLFAKSNLFIWLFLYGNTLSMTKPIRRKLLQRRLSFWLIKSIVYSENAEIEHYCYCVEWKYLHRIKNCVTKWVQGEHNIDH